MIMNIDNINLATWYIERLLPFTPVHFKRSNTKLTISNMSWIYQSCTGRFSVTVDKGKLYPCFEDPKEAMIYELRWG